MALVTNFLFIEKWRVPGAASYEDDVVDGGFVHLGIAHRLLNRLQGALHRNISISHGSPGSGILKKYYER
jgi:hypothetical protein